MNEINPSIQALIQSIQENTQAQLMMAKSQGELAKAIGELAASNSDIVDSILAEELEDKESPKYMDGSPKIEYL